MKRMCVVGGLASAVTVLLLAACTGGAAEEPGVQADPLAGALAEAQEADVDQSQIDVLSRAEVTFADYEAAMDRALTCMRDGRISIGTREVSRANGQEIVDYTFSQGALSEEDALAVHDDCYAKYVEYVDGYWQTGSPGAVAFQERRAEALHGPLTTCLDGYEIDYPDDASFRELVVASARHLEVDESQDCLGEVGYNEWDG